MAQVGWRHKKIQWHGFVLGSLIRTGETPVPLDGGFLSSKIVAWRTLMNLTGTSLYDRIGGRETLALLLRHFYSDIRQHNLVGPIFNEHIKDWPAHLETIASFWARLTGGPSTYSGGMPAKHMSLGVKASYFQAWLQLWEFNCHKYLKSVEAQEMSGALGLSLNPKIRLSNSSAP